MSIIKLINIKLRKLKFCFEHDLICLFTDMLLQDAQKNNAVPACFI